VIYVLSYATAGITHHGTHNRRESCVTRPAVLEHSGIGTVATLAPVTSTNASLQASSGRGAVSKSAAKAIERPGLTEEEIEEIREAFNLFDTDGSGTCLHRCICMQFMHTKKAGRASIISRFSVQGRSTPKSLRLQCRVLDLKLRMRQYSAYASHLCHPIGA
jgi:hypothetical protein